MRAPRRSRPTAVALLAVAAALVAGCASAAPLDDPRAVIEGSVAAVASARSYRYVATLDGSIPLPRIGRAETAPFDLEGTTIEGSVDVDGSAATAVVTIPGLGPALEAVVVGAELSVRVALLGGGYRRTTVAGSPFELLADPAAALRVLDELLATGPPPRLRGVVDCGDTRCYRVELEVSAGSVLDAGGLLGGLVGGALGGLGDLGSAGDPTGLGSLGLTDGSLGLTDGSLGGGLPVPRPDPAAGAGGTVELLVRVDDLLPVSFTARPAAPDVPSLTVAFDGWGEPVTVERPR
ncbi:MAG: hypothetical protein RL338_469 [Chloroflexota bacterium]|jgi:hypothetical protein